METKYLIKNATVFADTLKWRFLKPATCPHCGFGTDAVYNSKTIHSFNGHYLLLATCKCTSCQKDFFFAVEQNGDDTAKCSCIVPPISETPFTNEVLEKISERFIDMYNQALHAEFSENYELAAIGYRSALEILIKDYAIAELNEPEEKVSRKSLCDSIKDYLKQEDLINTADVVRILGNDYTHYKRKYPQHDFQLLKGYMDIFLKQIEVQYMIKHPPVSRTP